MGLLAFFLYMTSWLALTLTFVGLFMHMQNEKRATWDKMMKKDLKIVRPVMFNDFDDDETSDVLAGIKNTIVYIEKNIHYLSVEEQHYFERITSREMYDLIQTYVPLKKLIKEQQKEKFINSLLIIQNQLNEYNRTIDRQMVYQFERSVELLNQQK